MRNKELKYYGLHACWAIWKRRPQDIVRVYLDHTNVKTFRPLLKWCAEQRIAYHIIEADELVKVSDSIHHEGVCVLAREVGQTSWQAFCASLEAMKGPVCLLYLDGVQNPHNLGSIIRTAAHFGVPFILGEEGKMPALSPSACRIAKGGAEIVRLVSLSQPTQAFQWLQKKGFSILGTSSHGGTSLYRFSFPAQSIIAMGAESTGVGKSVLAIVNSKIQIPGSGLIESLNVSVAASLCMGEYCRQHPGEQ